jgi:PBP1b-binding outer membrane lipoprotein LpoB
MDMRILFLLLLLSACASERQADIRDATVEPKAQQIQQTQKPQQVQQQDARPHRAAVPSPKVEQSAPVKAEPALQQKKSAIEED